jgi:NAD(P) transhydrogenase subunit alpha
MSDVIEIFMTLEGFILSLTVFALAIFLGFELISKVPATLHTPLMSGANAISGISIVGALLAANSGEGNTATILAFIAIILATINVVGGFMVTNKMLQMIRGRKRGGN